MTKFLYITDTHLGAPSAGYQQQRRYPDRLDAILAALTGYLDTESDIDFVLHGGDMVDTATEEHLLAARRAFDLPVPVFLCLGNHDLTTPDAVDKWVRLAPQFFPSGEPVYTVTAGDCVIHVVPNHWQEIPFYCDGKQDAHFRREQIEQLSAELRRHSQLPQLIATHSPAYGLPTEQSGLPTIEHIPPAPFTADLNALVADHPNVRCVLGGHNHLNLRRTKLGTEFITASSLIETPFEFKRFEVTPTRLAMSTVSLAPAMDFTGEYDESKSYVQGRELDRALELKLGAPQA